MIFRHRLSRGFGASAARAANTSTSQSSAKSTIDLDQIKKNKYLDFNITSDLFRIDLGLLVERPAIYLPLE